MGKLFRKKFLWVLLVILVFFSLAIFLLTRSAPVKDPRGFGVTFSAFYAERLGVDWKKAYLAALDDLGVKKIRLPVYWNEVKKETGAYDFSRIDWQIQEAEKRGVEVILAIGRKLPRWPECHEPEWIKSFNLSTKNEKLLEYLRVTVNRYKSRPAVKIWQVENEPFLPFGECPSFSSKFLDQEIGLVRALDRRPIMITDSGELSIWIRAYRRSDIFGSTMYRVVWNPLVGTFKYPLPPSFFRLKRAITELIIGEKPMIVVELQGEPWASKMLYEISVEEQYISMNPEEFKKALNYARRSGFDTFYLWGVEWWYWLKEVKEMPEMWDIAKETITSVEIAR